MTVGLWGSIGDGRPPKPMPLRRHATFIAILFVGSLLVSLSLVHGANNWEFGGQVHRLGQTPPKPSSSPSRATVRSDVDTPSSPPPPPPPPPATAPVPSPDKPKIVPTQGSRYLIKDRDAPLCYENIDPINPYNKRVVPCELQVAKPKSGVRKGGNSNLVQTESAQNRSILTVDFNCFIDDQVRCGKAKKAFDQVGTILSNVLLLDEPLAVNASFFSFCDKLKQCGGDYQLLGGASPARTMILHDPDGLDRVYPQSLVKQLKTPQHPAFSKYDIQAQFNSDGDFWFQGDDPIKKGQSDFLFVVVHETIHGLGFTSSWMDYINEEPQALTPNPLAPDVPDEPTKSFVFNGFYENIFDRYLIELPTANYTSAVTRTLNQFNGGRGVSYTNQLDFIDKLTKSREYQSSIRMLSLATTPGKLAFMPKNATSVDDAVILETDLPKGFTQGSSISHFSLLKYTNSSDFLMRYLQDRGKLLRNDIIGTGNFAGGAIGPLLITCLETLGYPVNRNPQPIPLEELNESGTSTLYQRYSTDTLPWVILLSMATSIWTLAR